MNDKQFERKIAAKGTESLIAHIPTYMAILYYRDNVTGFGALDRFYI